MAKKFSDLPYEDTVLPPNARVAVLDPDEAELDDRNKMVAAVLFRGIDVEQDGDPVLAGALTLDVLSPLLVTDVDDGRVTLGLDGGIGIAVEDEGDPVATASILDIYGATVVDEGDGRVSVTVTGGGGGGGDFEHLWEEEVGGSPMLVATAPLYFGDPSFYEDYPSRGNEIRSSSHMGLGWTTMYDPGTGPETYDIIAAQYGFGGQWYSLVFGDWQSPCNVYLQAGAGQMTGMLVGNKSLWLSNDAVWANQYEATPLGKSDNRWPTFFGQLLDLTGTNGAASGTVAWTNAPSSETVQYIPAKFNNVEGWIPFIPAP